MVCIGQIISLVCVFIWYMITFVFNYECLTQHKKLDHIVDNLYLGNWYDSIDEQLLKNANITRILTLNTENTHTQANIAMFKRLGIKYKYIYINDNKHENISAFLDESLAFIKQDKQNVFVHCSAGVSRSVSIIIAYLIKEKKMTYDTALHCIRMIRPIANPNSGFVSQLKAYELKLKSKK